jgi:hypothetical protein
MANCGGEGGGGLGWDKLYGRNKRFLDKEEFELNLLPPPGTINIWEKW